VGVCVDRCGCGCLRRQVCVRGGLYVEHALCVGLYGAQFEALTQFEAPTPFEALTPCV